MKAKTASRSGSNPVGLLDGTDEVVIWDVEGVVEVGAAPVILVFVLIINLAGEDVVVFATWDAAYEMLEASFTGGVFKKAEEVL